MNKNFLAGILILLCAGFGLIKINPISAQDPTPTTVPVEFQGSVESINTTQITVNQITIDISGAQVTGELVPGQTVIIVGVLREDGSVAAQQIIVQTADPTPVPTIPPAPSSTEEPATVIMNKCPLGKGYWKKHTEAWALTTLTLGSQPYSQEELIALLNTPAKQDASLLLAQQIIIAQLNIASGSATTPESDAAIVQANTILTGYEGKLPYNLDPHSDSGAPLLDAAELVESYNKKEFTPDCVKDPNLPVVVVSGEIESIEGNILILNGTPVELDTDDPLLIVIQIGDEIEIEGEWLDVNGQIILVAFTANHLKVSIDLTGTIVECKYKNNGKGKVELNCKGKDHKEGKGDKDKKDDDKKDKDKDDD